jgi:hypothetical protein
MGTRRSRRNTLAGIFLIAVSLFATSLIGSTAADAATGRRPGHVYLLRGLLNVFSLGMDDLANKLQAVGVTATVHSYTVWHGLADDMIASYRAGNREPIILMGHSNGADTTILIARKLKDNGVPVALIVNFDPVSPEPVPSNVAQVVNFYVPAGWGQPVAADPRFRGKLANVNENGQTNHFVIDKDNNLHRQAIARVLAVVGSGGHRRGPPKPKNAQVSAVPQ